MEIQCDMNDSTISEFSLFQSIWLLSLLFIWSINQPCEYINIVLS